MDSEKGNQIGARVIPVQLSSDQESFLREHLSPENIDAICQMAAIARTQRSLANDHDSDKARSTALHRVTKEARRLIEAIEVLDSDGKLAFEQAALMNRPGVKAPQCADLIPDLQDVAEAADLAHRLLKRPKGKPADLEKGWLTEQVISLMRDAGIPVSNYQEGVAAKILMVAYDAAGMNTTYVRRRLKG